MNKIEKFYLKIFPVLNKEARWLYPVRNSVRYWLYAKKHGIFLRHLEKNHADIIAKYKNIRPTSQDKIDRKSTVWVMWFQGEEAMPPIVKACYANLKKHAGEHPVVLLTEKNIRQFTNNNPLWTDEIFKFVENNNITKTHFADIMRCFLLYNYGGFWIDSTVWMNRDLDEVAGDLSFVSGRVHATHNRHVPEGKWTTFFIGTSPGNPLMKFMYETMLAHVRKEGRFIDYFIIDYTFVVAYNNLPYVREMIDRIPLMPCMFHIYDVKACNKAFDESEFYTKAAISPLFKLTYKGDKKLQTPDGRPTLYAHLINQNL